ncbi:MAG: EAL domain-containing protein [Eubacteriales bacterium]|nr:EAL domain-containing protein [Eubacteriales bacterium]
MSDHHVARIPELAQYNPEHLLSLGMGLVAVVSQDGLLLKTNLAWETILGHPVDQLINQPFISMIHPDDVRSTQIAMSSLINKENLAGFVNRYRCRDGSYRLMEWNAQMRDGLIYAIARDVTERAFIRKQMQTEHERLELAIWGTSDGIWDWDLVASTLYLSPRWKEQLGYADFELESYQELFFELLHPDDRDRIKQVINDYLQRKIETYDVEFRLQHKNGDYRWIQARGKAFWGEDGKAYRMAGAHTDITERKNQEKQIELLSFHDQLTGLFNRHSYEKLIEEWTHPFKKNDFFSLIVADVNGLKLANDAFGHEMGDRLLLAFANALRKVARPQDLAARLGGDEFILFMPVTSETESDQIFTALTQACQEEKIDFLDLSVSLGSTSIVSKATTIQDAYKIAEDAMYEQKMVEGERYRNAMVQHMVDCVLLVDPAEKAHAERVAQICVRMGKLIGFNASQLAALELAGRLHDIGKIGLDPEHVHWNEHAQGYDSEDLKKHVQIGYYILHSASQYTHVAEAVLAHHECYDGEGYPKGLKGQEIPLIARILKIANEYEILVRSGLSVDAAIERMTGLAGSAYDPALMVSLIEQAVFFDGANRLAQDRLHSGPMATALDPYLTEDLYDQQLSDQIAGMIANHQMDDALGSLVSNQQLFEAFYQYHQKSKAALTPFKHVFDHANYGLSINELDGTTLYINPYFARIHGFEPEELIGAKIELFHTPAQQKQVFKLVKKIIEQGGFQAEEVWHVDRAGQEFPMLMTGIYIEGDVERGQKPYMAATSIDIREIKAQEAEIMYLNQHDPLTGLLNRNALNSLMIEGQHDSNAQDQSVLFINIDKFKLVNDALGHQAGDDLLVQLTGRLVAMVGAKDCVYRYGGDEFLILLPLLEPDQVMTMAKSIQQMIVRQIDIHHSAVLITASQGICIGQPGLTLEQTITRAETALYEAKKKRNTIAIYQDSMEKARTRDVLLEQDLQYALEHNQFELFYQPIFNVRTGRIDQAEALLRWNHPVFGRVPPLDFIPIAERTRLIIPITDWVIRQACAKVAEWSRLGIEGIMVSVNLSILSIENRGHELVDFIATAITDSGISPFRLKLEITESTLVNDLDEIVAVFQKLKQIGVKLALDDFGTGYSSFGYMKDLPLDIMKLDRSLIGNIDVSEKEQMIVGSMVTIIHGLGLEVVIEGVETKKQLDSLMKFDCDYIQGYYFSKPLPADEFLRYFFSVTEQYREDFLSEYPPLHSQVHLDWQEEWNSGNTQIDRQHQELMQDANRLIRLALDGKDLAKLLQELDLMIEHIMEHFAYEEQVLEAIGYPELKAHQKEHERLVRELLQLKQNYLQKTVRPTVFFSFLVDQVILGHQIDEDAKYFSWTRQTT